MDGMRQAREVMTVPEIAAWRGVDEETVRQDRYRFRDAWPAPAGTRPSGGRGRPLLEYDAATVKVLYRHERPHAIRRAEPPGDGWDPAGLVDGQTAAARLGVAWNTFRMYPRNYARTSNPFPAPDPRGPFPWGVIADWKRRCPGSGRRDQATMDDPVPAASAPSSGSASVTRARGPDRAVRKRPGASRPRAASS